MDEPPATEFDRLRPLIDYLRQRDPNHVARINLFPSNGEPKTLGAANYADYLTQFFRTIRPALLSYDFYQFHENGDVKTYLENLEIVSRKAHSAGVPFMTFVQAASWGPGIRIPTADEERFLVYTTLAYGTQGIGYYVWCWPGHTGGIVDPQGRPTPIYQTLRSANREFVAIAKQYQSWQWLGTYVKGYRSGHLPPGTTELPANASFDIAGVANDRTYKDGQPVKGVLFGFFAKDGDTLNDATLAVVVNLDYTAGKTYTVTGPGNLSVFNAATGIWTATRQRSATLELSPGGGMLVGLTSAARK